MSVGVVSLEKNVVQDKEQKVLQIGFSDLDIVDFQLNMINNHENRGLAQVEKYVFNNNISLKYDITGYLSLEEYIQTTMIDANIFKAIFTKIAGIVNNCTDLLLESNNFILEKDTVYVNPVDLNIVLINLPLVETYSDNIECDYINLASDIIKDLLISSKIKDGSGEFILKVNKLISDKKLSISDFIKDINECDTKVVVEAKPVENKPAEKKDIEQQPKPQSKPKPAPKPKQQPKPKSITKPTPKPEPKKEPEVQTIEKFRYKTSRIVALIITQPIIIGVILGLMMISEGNMLQMIGGSILMLVLDGIIIKNLLDPSKREKVKVMVKNQKTNKEKVSKDKTSNKSKQNLSKKKEVKSNVDDDATQFLNDDATDILCEDAYLQIDNAEPVPINSDNFVIGRQAQLQEFISGKSIGRMHAQITKYGGCYYLEDLESKNGTSLNGSKINPGERFELNDGDIITLAELTIIFRLY